MSAWIYVSIYLFSCTGYVLFGSSRNTRLYFILILYAIILIFVGLRHEVGGDWLPYLRYLERASGVSFWEGMALTDPAYALFNWVGANTPGGIYLTNTLTALVALSGLTYFCVRQEDPLLSYCIAIPYIVTVVFMGYTRQSASIGLTLAAIPFIIKGSFLRAGALIVAAALFHKTAIIMVPVLFFQLENNKIRLLVLIVASLLLSALLALFHDRILFMVQIYIAEPMLSNGTLMRIGVSLIAAFFYATIVRKHIQTRSEKKLWDCTSILVVALFIAGLWFSTLADRLALYFMGLQLFVWPRLSALMPTNWDRFYMRAAVMLFNGALLVIWLSFGDSAERWLPYQSVLGI